MRSLEFLKFTNVTQYYPQTEQGGLFVDYINTFLNLKKGQRVTRLGWKPDDEDRYVDNFYASEGIRLD